MTAANDQDSMWVRRIPNNQTEIDAVVEILKDWEVIFTIDWRNLELGKDGDGKIEGSIDSSQFEHPQFDEQGYLSCEIDIAYAYSERTDYCLLPIRLWVESNPAQDTHRVGWEIVGLEDQEALAGPSSGYCPDMFQLVRLPNIKRDATKQKCYKFTRDESDLLRIYDKSRRERIRRMSPYDRGIAVGSAFWLNDDMMIELGRTPSKPLTGEYITPGMIVRGERNLFRIVVAVDKHVSRDGKTRCAYVEYSANHAVDATKPKLKRGYPDARRGTTDEVAEWAHKVVRLSRNRKVLLENWHALEKRQQQNKQGGEHEPI